jgi:hypothetical protein
MRCFLVNVVLNYAGGKMLNTAGGCNRHLNAAVILKYM